MRQTDMYTYMYKCAYIDTSLTSLYNPICGSFLIVFASLCMNLLFAMNSNFKRELMF